MVYIDDYNAIEHIKYSEALSHITTQKRTLKVLAQKSESIFENVCDLAKNIHMKVNSKKTQMLCVHANKDNQITSYITTGSDEIVSSPSLKILGFTFGTEPNANKHVLMANDKMYSKLWTLRYLIKSGMNKGDWQYINK